jgi:hypothetical protein
MSGASSSASIVALPGRCLLLVCLASGLQSSTVPAASDSLSPAELRGSEIYHEGTSPAEEEISALMMGPAVEVPGAILPCVNCHGADGRGKPEGNGSPTDITREALTRPDGVRHATGREHPPYTESLLARAIAAGVDPAGNKLHVAMPRYRMTESDMEDLVAYLLRIDTTAVWDVGSVLPACREIQLRRVVSEISAEREIEERSGPQTE